MRVKIVTELPWVEEKGIQYHNPQHRKTWMHRAFKALLFLEFQGEVATLADGSTLGYYLETRALRAALRQKKEVSGSVHWSTHWNRIGLLDHDAIGIPASCCQVLEEET